MISIQCKSHVKSVEVEKDYQKITKIKPNLAVKKPSALLRQITSKYHGDFYGLN